MSHPSSPSLLAIVLAFSAIWSLSLQPVQAYLDPGTGSYLFQIALASLFGLLFGIKMFWLQIKAFFLRLLGKAPAADTVQPTSPAPAAEAQPKTPVKKSKQGTSRG